MSFIKLYDNCNGSALAQGPFFFFFFIVLLSISLYFYKTENYFKICYQIVETRSTSRLKRIKKRNEFPFCMKKEKNDLVFENLNESMERVLFNIIGKRNGPISFSREKKEKKIKENVNTVKRLFRIYVVLVYMP